MAKLFWAVALTFVLSGCPSQNSPPTVSPTAATTPSSPQADVGAVATPTIDEESGESSPENAEKSLQAAQAADANPDYPVIVAVPEGFTSEMFGSHEGTAVMIDGGGGQVHIFIPNPEVSTTGEESVTGSGGLFESNGWSRQEAGRQTQPNPAWATGAFPFFDSDGKEGVVWLGDFRGTEVRVTASAPEGQLDEFYQQVGPMVTTLELRE